MSRHVVDRPVRASAPPEGARLLHQWLAPAARVRRLLLTALAAGALLIPDPAPGVAQGTWTATSTVAAPTGRHQHTAVWTGSRMIVWGGNEGGLGFPFVDVNTGGIYDPSSDSWTATSTTGAPEARERHTAVWTGSKMIVWGGVDSHWAYLDPGGVYDPATDSWATTSTTGAPAAREGHTAVWTGSKMIVWGGATSAGYFNTGGVYDPATDTWTATSTIGAPTGRWLHAAVWTGSRMIVWGGAVEDDQSDYIQLDTGGIYDPATDSWTATSTTGAPDARLGPTAAWTGSRMIVWGGYGEYGPGASGLFNTGGIYDPTTDSWTATSTTGALFLSQHAAVWTGSRMILWGGYQGFLGRDTNTGRIYDPATDSWAATSTTGAPNARRFPTGVWTGSRMIVWGGFNYISVVAVDTGGTYDPGTLSPPEDVHLSNGVPYPDSMTAVVRQASWKYYSIDVPAGTSWLKVVLDDLTADVDLYVRSVAKPDGSTFDCRSWKSGTTTETCSFYAPTAARWWIGVNNYATETISYRVTATAESFPLLVSKAGPGTGTVTSSPAGIACGSSCSATFPAGATVTLKAAPAGGSTFAGWSGSGCSGTGTCTVAMNVSAVRYVTATFTLWSPGVSLYTVTPCRVFDTREASGPTLGKPLTCGTERSFAVAGKCGVPSSARAVSLNLTGTGSTAQGNLRLFATGTSAPLASTLNYVAGQTRANNAVVPLGATGEISVLCSPAGATHVVLDVNGYFE